MPLFTTAAQVRRALEDVRSILAMLEDVKTLSQTARTEAASSATERARVLQLMRFLNSRRDMIQGFSGSDAEAMVAAELALVVAAIDDVLAFVDSSFPKDGGLYVTAGETAGGQTRPLEFTVQQMSGLVTRLDALVAAIG